MSGFDFVLLGRAGVLHRDKLHRDPQSEVGVLCRGEHGGTFPTVSFSVSLTLICDMTVGFTVPFVYFRP